MNDPLTFIEGHADALMGHLGADDNAAIIAAAILAAAERIATAIEETHR